MRKAESIGTGALLRMQFRRDRISLPIWIIGLTLFFFAFYPVFNELYGSEQELVVMGEMMKNPAMIALVGPAYGADNYTLAASYGNMMLLFSTMLSGLMSIFLVTRHTRQDEELGRLEMIRSLPVGRLANVYSNLLYVVLANLIIAVLTIIGLIATGAPTQGSIIFGAGVSSIGIFFAASTALFAQFSSSNRTVLGLSFLWMGILYIIRAAGDVSSEALSLLSPLGLVLRTENFVNDNFWPIVIILLISGVIAFIAVNLAVRRDLGQGLFAAKGGKVHGGPLLSSPMGLAIKLIRTMSIVWLVTIFSFAAMYGSIFGDLDGFLESNEMLKQIFNEASPFSLAEQFISLLMVIMSIFTAIATLMIVNRNISEEKNGRTEHVLARAVHRWEQLTAYVLPAFLLSVLLQFMSALGFWSVGSAVLETAPSLKTFTIAAMNYLPAIWLTLAIAVFLIGWMPKFSILSYIYLGYSFLVIYIGSITKMPEWTQKMSPFGHIARYPIEEIEPLPVILLLGVSVLLIIAGYWGYKKRDILSE